MKDANNNFLPPDYKQPDNSNYLKLKEGENVFRVLSEAITGFEYWTTDNKPIRSKEPFEETPNIKVDKEGGSRVKHFWAFIVWNYEAKKVQVALITQSTIQEGILALFNNKNWGDPKLYDLTITRSGEGLDTSYVVQPNPHSDLPEEAKGVTGIKLEALYKGDDPFKT